jgi:hypothetical protein
MLGVLALYIIAMFFAVRKDRKSGNPDPVFSSVAVSVNEAPSDKKDDNDDGTIFSTCFCVRS